jgi:hypothetical protein
MDRVVREHIVERPRCWKAARIGRPLHRRHVGAAILDGLERTVQKQHLLQQRWTAARHFRRDQGPERFGDDADWRQLEAFNQLDHDAGEVAHFRLAGKPVRHAIAWIIRRNDAKAGRQFVHQFQVQQRRLLIDVKQEHGPALALRAIVQVTRRGPNKRPFVFHAHRPSSRQPTSGPSSLQPLFYNGRCTVDTFANQ